MEKEQNSERFEGRNAEGEWIFLTDSRGLGGTGGEGGFRIRNNEALNGNCWIGHLLIVNADGTQYYIRELSRSEGYELMQPAPIRRPLRPEGEPLRRESCPPGKSERTG